jgi:hypothetical protein
MNPVDENMLGYLRDKTSLGSEQEKNVPLHISLKKKSKSK